MNDLSVAAAPSALALVVPFAPRSTLQWIDQICSTADRPMFSSATPPPGAAAPPVTIVTTLSCEALPWLEPPRALDLLAENPDPLHPAKPLAFFIADNKCGPLVIPEPQK